MSDPRFRARVARLLRGDFRADDLKTLFLYARDRCNGSEAVREVGDFIAHHDERNKGIITRSTRDWFVVTRFMAPRFMPGASPLSEWSLPPATPAYLKAAFSRKSSATFRSQAGMSVTAGRRALDRLLRRFERNIDGTLRLTRFILPDEQAVFNALTASLDAVYAFSGEELFKDFRVALIKNKLLLTSEQEQFNLVKEAVIVLAVASMHNNDILMDDKSKIRLTASPAFQDGLIQVNAAVPVNPFEGKPISISSPIFGGAVTLKERLTEELQTEGGWNFEIELRDDGKLHAIH